MPDSFVIKPFLVTHRAEVRGMLLTEYNETEQMELFKEDGIREGLIKGMISLVKDGQHPDQCEHGSDELGDGLVQ